MHINRVILGVICLFAALAGGAVAQVAVTVPDTTDVEIEPAPASLLHIGLRPLTYRPFEPLRQDPSWFGSSPRSNGSTGASPSMLDDALRSTGIGVGVGFVASWADALERDSTLIPVLTKSGAELQGRWRDRILFEAGVGLGDLLYRRLVDPGGHE